MTDKQYHDWDETEHTTTLKDYQNLEGFDIEEYSLESISKEYVPAASLIAKPESPIGHLHHKPTNTYISVYHKINRFHRFFIKLCFGMEYVEN